MNIEDQPVQPPSSSAALDEGTEMTLNESNQLPPTPPVVPSPVVASPETQLVKLSIKRQDEALPQGRTNIGCVGIEIPEKTEQLFGFELTKDQAAVLVGQFAQYKFAIEKGQETPVVSV